MKNQTHNGLQRRRTPAALGKSFTDTRTRQNHWPLLVSCLFALLLAGCASTTVTNRQVATGKIPKPGQIWVYPFVATPGDIPAGSPLAGQMDLDTTPQTPEQIAEGKKLGADIAAELVADIHKLGKPAQVATADTKPQLNDLVIRGYLLSIQEGSAAKRVGIGFGSGASELKAAVEGYQMTADGLHKLGSGTVEAGGSKAPGASLGVVGLLATHNPAGLIISSGIKVYGEKSGNSTVDGRAKQIAQEIADVLDKRFQQAGWVN